MEYIGRVIISSQLHARHNEFYVWSTYAGVDVGSTLVVAEDDSERVLGLVTDSYTTSVSADDVNEYYSSGLGDPTADGPVEPRAITVYKVKVMRRVPPIMKPITRRLRVRLANVKDAELLNQLIKPGHRVLAGFARGGGEPEDPGSWIPVYYDARYLAGPEGAHININGKSGLAAKTSYALFLITVAMHWALSQGLRVAAVLFNVKQCDLFRLVAVLDLQSWGQVEELIKQYFSNRPEVARANIGMWRWIAREFKLAKPSDLIPHDSSGKPMLSLWTYSAGDPCVGIAKAHGVQPRVFSYGVKDLSEYELEELLAGGDYDSLTEAQRDYVTQLARNLLNMQGVTFGALLEDAANLVMGRPSRILGRVGGQAVRDETRRVIARKIVNTLGNAQGLAMLGESGDPIAGVQEGLNIIQLNMPSQAVQRLVFGNVLRQLMRAQEGGAFDHVLVFVDELNKFAPRRGDSPIRELIREVAARARSLNIGLVGAQQFATLIDEEVYGNASTYVIGNTDDSELESEEYRKFGEFRGLIPSLSQGEVVVYQVATQTTPIKVVFPIMLHELVT